VNKYCRFGYVHVIVYYVHDVYGGPYAIQQCAMRSDIFVFFFEKPPLLVMFSKFCTERFHRNTDRLVLFKLREIWTTGNR